MTLTEIYAIVKLKADTITGQSYVIDRAPSVNFSEEYSGVYRFIRPAGVNKERTTRGKVQTTLNIEVGILSTGQASTNIDSIEDEIDGLLNAILGEAQIAPNLIVYAAECRPTSEQIINSEGLEAEVPVIEATATIGIRAFY